MSNHSTPIVPTVLYVAEQRHPWRLAVIDRFAVAYHTPTTVRVGTKGGTTRHQHQVYCIVDDAAWGRVLYTQAALQTDLNALADGLRALGSYAKRLDAAGGMKAAPNPLCPTVISAPDPDTADEGYWFTNRLVPQIERQHITSHTPKMLHIERNGEPWSTSHQRDHFVCPADADWERILALVELAAARAKDWEQLLRELGTYQTALADGRYASKEAFMQQPLASQPATTLASTEQEALTRCEAIIARGVQTFIEVGEALAEIRDGKLYRAISGTFDEYCRERWGIGRGRAYQLMEAATVTREMSTVVDNPPKTEREARAVAKAVPADRPRVLDRADQLAGGNGRTAKHIEQATEEIGIPPADFDGAQRRFAALGWKVEKHGVWWKLSKPDGTHYATAAPAQQLQTLATFEAGAAKRAAVAKPATCIRCGAERTERVGLTSYQAGLIDAYPGRSVTLCSRCIPELLHAQRAAQREAAIASREPPPAAPAPTRMTCPTCQEPILNGIWGDLKECGECYHARQRYQAHQAAPLSRPRRPQSADVSVQLRYLEQLEAYATALEQRNAELERWLAAPLTFIRTQLAICEQRIADGTADAVTGAELATLAMDLEALADDESVSTDVYERLAVRLGQAQRGLVELPTEVSA